MQMIWLMSGLDRPDENGVYRLVPSTPMGTMLFDLLSEIFTVGFIPPSLLKSLLLNIPKKGDPLDMGNYRPISLLEALLKLQATILLRRLQPLLPHLITTHQTGFVQGEEPMSNVASIFEIVQRRHIATTPTYGVFLDIKSAFDAVNHELLFRKLERIGIRGKMLKLLRAMYQGNSQYILLDGMVGDPIQLLVGVRQGCPLSPTLFALFINDLPEVVTPRLQVPGLAGPINASFLFADDLSILADSIGNVQVILDALGVWMVNNRMAFGINKCGVMAFRDPAAHEALRLAPPSIGGVPIPVVDSYMYLGLKIDTTAN